MQLSYNKIITISSENYFTGRNLNLRGCATLGFAPPPLACFSASIANIRSCPEWHEVKEL
jgi:hypothetical protein